MRPLFQLKDQHEKFPTLLLQGLVNKQLSLTHKQDINILTNI